MFSGVYIVGGKSGLEECLNFWSSSAVTMADMENTCAIKVGRLLEIRRAQGHKTQTDVKESFNAIAAELAKLPRGTKVVAVVDWRACPLLSDEVSESLISKMTGNNPLMELSAVIASADSPIQVLQFQRLIRDTHYSHRKLFFNPSELINWLRPALNQDEFQRLGEFLAEHKVH